MITVLHYRIERARTKLHELSEEHGGFMHPKVLIQSMILDELINKYYQEKTKKNRSLEAIGYGE